MSPASTVPAWIANIKGKNRRERWTHWYKHPWRVPLRRLGAPWFKWVLWRHGLLSPHFSRAEARSGDGKNIPLYLRRRAQLHAFSLERVRHELGDRGLNPISWYRSPAHNAAVGGATASRHMKADATDWPELGQGFDDACERHFTGLGYQGGIWVRHADNGPRRTWTY